MPRKANFTKRLIITARTRYFLNVRMFLRFMAYKVLFDQGLIITMTTGQYLFGVMGQRHMKF